MKNKWSIPRSAALAFLLVGNGLSAAVVFDNLNTPDASAEINSSSWYGQSFVVGADATLTSVVLNMEAVAMPADPGGNFFVRIYDATGPFQSPGASLTELLGNTNPFEDKDYVFTPAGILNLAANIPYYVVLGVSSGNGYYNWAGENASSIEIGATIGLSSSFDAGDSWAAPVSDAAFSMQINADFSPVPEPVNVALGLLGILFLGVQSFRSWIAQREPMNLLPDR